MYKRRFGIRASGAFWWDPEYSSPFDNTSVATANVLDKKGSQLIDHLSKNADEYYNGPEGELLDAFVFARIDPWDVPIYMDEDLWYTCLSDLYDIKGNLWRTKLLLSTFNYDVQAPTRIYNDTGFDLIARNCCVNTHPADEGGIFYVPHRNPKDLSPPVLSGRGIR